MIEHQNNRRPWSDLVNTINLYFNFQKEDREIRLLVFKHGVRKWTVIADEMQQKFGIIKGRSGK